MNTELPDYSVLPLEVEFPEAGELLLALRDWLRKENRLFGHPALKGHVIILTRMLAFKMPGERFWEKIEGPNVGRNEPCPCSSGKKFKNCCGSIT
jgi:SEC-C motif